MASLRSSRPLAAQFLAEGGHPREIATGSSQAADQAGSDGVSGRHYDDRNCTGRVLGGHGARGRPSNDNINLKTDEFSRQFRELIKLPFCKPVLDGYVLALDPAVVAKPLPKCRKDGGISRGGDNRAIRGTFFGCCAAAGKLSEKSRAHKPEIRSRRSEIGFTTVANSTQRKRSVNSASPLIIPALRFLTADL
jgi:hypothetical protein